jgi:hypothetical protein
MPMITDHWSVEFLNWLVNLKKMKYDRNNWKFMKGDWGWQRKVAIDEINLN